ncbi:T9SS type A sorting domain-containing protein [Sporocytophaga myxococcoides]|uniref:T9SS type A sorting domain-containing protein n=1 Tax=Sporocytophaga myxococcoides TaxID=153721 RepID=UPI0004287117|nr:T9SS type A sorting domain-containing protein [Sporocytophaga myxococcoides]
MKSFFTFNQSCRLICLFLLIHFCYAASHAQNKQWLKAFGGPNKDVVNSSAQDINGDLFLTGIFQGSLTIGDTTLVGNNSYRYIFLAKLDGAGNLKWVKNVSTIRQTGTEIKGSDLCIDNKGSVYVTGVQNFGNYFSTFTSRYDTLGNLIWNKTGSGQQNVTANSIAADKDGSVLIVGEYGFNAVFGSKIIQYSSFDNIFLVKYDSLGNELFAKSAGGSGTEYARGVSADSSGNFYITGIFTGSGTNLGTFTLNNSSTSSTSDIFIAKINSEGLFQWAKKIGNSNSDQVSGIDVHPSGNVYISGSIGGASSSGNKIFTGMFDSNGKTKWIDTLQLSSPNVDRELKVDAAGNCYITGHYEGSQSIAGINFNLFTVVNGSTLIVKYDAAGNRVWAKNLEQVYSGTSISISPTGHIVFSGYFTESRNVESEEISAKGFGDICLVKFCDTTFSNVKIIVDEAILSSESSFSNQWFYNGQFLSSESGNSIYALADGVYKLLINNGCAEAFDEIDFHGIQRKLGKLFAPVFKGAVYEWYQDERLIENETESSFYPLENGIYTVKINICNNCRSNKSISAQYSFKVDDVITSVNNNNFDACRVEVVPNPATDIVKFTNISAKDFQIDLMSSTGDHVLHLENKNALDLFSLSNGIYFFLISGSDGNILGSGKIIKK